MSPFVKSQLVYYAAVCLLTYLMDHYDPPHTAFNIAMMVIAIAIWSVLTLVIWRNQLDRAARPEGKTPLNQPIP